MEARKKEQVWQVAIFILPCMVVIGFFYIFPTAYSIYLALHNWTISSRLNPAFVGLHNFREVIFDWRFWSSVKVTFSIMLTAISVEFTLGLAMALLLDKAYVRGKDFFRVIILMPMMIAPMVIGYTFRLLYHSTAGPLNYILGLFGIGMLAWLENPRLAFWAVIIADTWEWSPFIGLILLAGLQSIPTPLQEAARMDRASPWQVFRFITFPLLIPTVIIVIILRMIDCTKIFDLVYTLTQGGPGTATEVMYLYIYIRGFRSFDLSYAAAMSWFLLGFTILASQSFLRILIRKRSV